MKLIILAVVAILAVAGCSDDKPSDDPTPTASSTTVEPTSAPPATGDGTAVPTASEPSIEGPDWPTEPVSAEFDTVIPPMPTMYEIRQGTHADYDRLAFEFTNLPNYNVMYVSDVVYDGSGDPVNLNGEAYLQLVFNPAQAHNDAGQPTLPSPLLNQVRTGYPAIQAYVMNGDFEGYVSVALGVSAKLGFHVEQIQQPDGAWVVYIDVAHP